MVLIGVGPTGAPSSRGQEPGEDRSMNARCACGNPITHSHGELGCIQCGQPCCHACGALLESVMYCDRCAGALLGVEVIGHVGTREI